MKRLIDRDECPMRHENGNCTVAGGFCTAVNDPICEALHNAFYCGEYSNRKNGYSVTLPCKVGDTVYVTEPRYYNGAMHTGIQNGKVYGFEFEEEWVVWVHLADDNPYSGNAYPFADFGKTVFLTKEAAERVLGGMKNEA